MNKEVSLIFLLLLLISCNPHQEVDKEVQTIEKFLRAWKFMSIKVPVIDELI